MGGTDELCVTAFARALEVIPYTLSENAGLNPIEVVTELRSKHHAAKKFAGVDIKRVRLWSRTDYLGSQGCCTDDMIADLNIVQPLLVTLSALKLATETIVMLLKIYGDPLCFASRNAKDCTADSCEIGDRRLSTVLSTRRDGIA